MYRYRYKNSTETQNIYFGEKGPGGDADRGWGQASQVVTFSEYSS